MTEMKTEILDTLFGARDKVTALVIELSPQNPSQREQLVALLQRRDRLTAAIQRVIEAHFNEAAHGLTDAIAGLEAATARLEALDESLERIGDALAIIDDIVGIAASAVAIATGL